MATSRIDARAAARPGLRRPYRDALALAFALSRAGADGSDVGVAPAARMATMPP